jgi:hypothetical protein
MSKQVNNLNVTEKWALEFEPEEVPTVEVLRKFVNATLCCCITIGKRSDSSFVMLWKERHPELGTYEEYFAADNGDRDYFSTEDTDGHIARTEERLAEWGELRERLPSASHCEEISRAQAWEAIVKLWLPAEFHKDAGFCNVRPKSGLDDTILFL